MKITYFLLRRIVEKKLPSFQTTEALVGGPMNNLENTEATNKQEDRSFIMIFR